MHGAKNGMKRDRVTRGSHGVLRDEGLQHERGAHRNYVTNRRHGTQVSRFRFQDGGGGFQVARFTLSEPETFSPNLKRET